MDVKNTVGDHVVVSRLVAGDDGRGRFLDVTQPYDQVLGPLRQSQAIEASRVSFHWWPLDFAGGFTETRGQYVVLMLEGAARVESGDGEARVFRPGDVLDLDGAGIAGHRIASSDGQAFRAAMIDLSPGSDGDMEEPEDRLKTGQTLPFVRNVTGDDMQSHFQDGVLAYYHREAGGEVTSPVAITRFQYVYAASDLRYDWHNAPQRQIVLPLTGGTQGENGDGSRRVIPAGGVYFGEDITGQGHITSAVNDAIRFSIFAHLA
jgi:hypothetical protein